MNNCGCCCTRILNLCDQDVCGNGIDFNITAQSDGEHTLHLTFLGVISFKIKKTFTTRDEIIFPVDQLSEDYQYTTELFDPNGDKILIAKNGIDYDCFRFKTVINKTITVAAIESGS